MTRLIYASLAALALSAGAASAMTDHEFLSEAIKGDNSEIALGKLAADKGGSVNVKTFGRVLITDHTQHLQQVSMLAKQMGVASPTESTPEAQQEQAKLNGLSGEAFDREFVNHMIMDHQKDIAEYKDEAKGDSPVAKLAAQSVPVLEKHLQLAEGLKGKP